METLLLLNGLSAARRVVDKNNKAWWVASATIIVPGVLNGSRGALLYPEEEVVKNPGIWNKVAITVRHPFDPITNSPLSVSSPGVFDRQGIGYIQNDRIQDGKRLVDCWFHEDKTRAVDNRIYEALVNKRPMELSTGLFTENEDNPGSHGDRPYNYIARNYRPDHLAILPDETGACSLRDGCGLMVNSEDGLVEGLPELEELPEEEDELEVEEEETPEVRNTFWTWLGESLGVLNCGGKGGKPGPCKGQKVTLKSVAEKIKAAKKGVKDVKKDLEGPGQKKTKEDAAQAERIKQADTLRPKIAELERELSHYGGKPGDWAAGLRNPGLGLRAQTEIRALHHDLKRHVEARDELVFGPAPGAKRTVAPASPPPPPAPVPPPLPSPATPRRRLHLRSGAGGLQRIANVNETDSLEDVLWFLNNCGGAGGKPGPCPLFGPLKVGDLKAPTGTTKIAAGGLRKGDKVIDPLGQHKKVKAVKPEVTHIRVHWEGGGEYLYPKTQKVNRFVANAQGRHPKDGKWQGKASSAAAQGFLDGRITDESGEPIEDEDDEIGLHDRPSKARTKEDDIPATDKVPTPLLNQENDMNKGQLVTWLVANCECWKGAEASLNTMEVTQLAKLKASGEKALANEVVANAFTQIVEEADVPGVLAVNEVPAFIKAKMDKKKGKKDDEEEEEVTNKVKKEQTLEEWEASLPPAAKNVWNSVKVIEAGQRQELIKKLTANTKDEATKKRLVANLSTLDVPQLTDMLALLPPAPTTNSQDLPPLETIYIGANGGPAAGGTTNNSDDDANDILPLSNTVQNLIEENRKKA